ncbi:hypothetical protein Q8A67_008630 [Cirrhinus molitorella]|uniref:Uncharacterized protein n=1 Tax=Cirrhinus molitorella TaxID=172907 RepID=A0AA88TQW1_9TELE|nr:hypothetical protein Q8A67_008630 [Cirrhinus molitorella]
MQKTDSGLYTAIAAAESDKNIVTYKVSVIDAVEAPVLTVNSKWISGNFCTVNFTCRAHKLKINSSYQNNSCSPEEVTSHENYTLILYCREKFIICNHTNPVSWKDYKINITQLCEKEENYSNQSESSPLWSVGVSVAACTLICLLVFLYCKYKKGAQEEVAEGSTIYSQIQAEAQTQEERRDNQSTTVYCTVGQHQKPTIPPETDHAIYSGVCKPNNTPSAISQDDT